MGREDPARQAWALAFQLGMSNRNALLERLEILDLTFMQAHVLRMLEAGEPRPMSELAGALKCDASNITGIADRLEARGLVERLAVRDRRVKALALTPKGMGLKEQLYAAFTEPPEALKRLPKEDQRALRDILRRALSG